MSFFNTKNFENITICNRSPRRARAIAEKNKLSILDWKKLSQWPTYDWVIFGTKSSEHLISKKDFAGKSIGHKLIIDLCVPRNVDPNLARDPQITLLNIDQINRSLNIRRQRMMSLLSHAENIVHDDTKRQIELFCEKERKRDRIFAVSG
ncbi:MAG: hypothetical protein ACE5G1_16510 [bacterium]